MIDSIHDTFRESLAVIGETAVKQAYVLEDIARIVYNCMSVGNKLLICGNGGSASQADHLAAEFLVRLKPDVNRKPWPAISLNMDMATLTACSNDYGYAQHFARVVEALGHVDDVLMVISTSGESPNLYPALCEAQNTLMKTVGLFGAKETVISARCDIAFHVQSDNVARIQEVHAIACHVIAEQVETLLLNEGV